MSFTNKCTTFLSVILFATYLRQTQADDICSASTGSDVVWRRHPISCGSLYICVLGRTVLYQKCPVDQVIASDGTTCVPPGSYLDDCTRPPVGAQAAVRAPKTCKLGETSPSPDSCAIYSECVTMGKDAVSFVKMECPFPLLYDSASSKCDHYKNAKCQPGQMVPKNPCDYEANQCKSVHCVPCYIRFPSCNGRQDGLHPWAGKEWSPFFVMCETERVLYQGECKSDKEAQVFHPEQKNCVTYDEKKNY